MAHENIKVGRSCDELGHVWVEHRVYDRENCRFCDARRAIVPQHIRALEKARHYDWRG